MILSVSRRTDIPAFYSNWFFNRIKEGYVLTQNPMNTNQISKVKITPDVIDCIVFWTKNPKNMLDKFHLLKDYNYYFQFTLNSYDEDIESGLPSKNENIINTFKELSKQIGKEKVIWRYDPIFLNDKYDIEYHIKYFEKLASILNKYTNRCVFSYLDEYRKIKGNMKKYNLRTLDDIEKKLIAKEFSKIALEQNLKLETCAEKMELDEFEIEHSSCIDGKLIEDIFNIKLKIKKDKNQRDECGCVESIDIGMYNTCKHGCKYCYANFSDKTVMKNTLSHNEKSELMMGKIGDDVKIKERVVKSLIEKNLSKQLEMFD